MTFIYPHTDPEILKLGIRMALYREKKPGKPEGDLSPYNDYDDYISHEFPLWQQSRIAYLKEQEFKVADEVYKISTGLKYEFVELQNRGRVKLWDEDNCMYVIANIKDLSHYCPGQQYDGEVKYVREVAIIDKVSIPYKSRELKYHKQWQEVEEPNANNIEYYYNNHWDLEKFEKDHTQFQEGVNKGEILAEI